MNRKINILWVEDNLNGTVKRFQKKVESIIKKSYYEVAFINAEEMHKSLKSDKESGESFLEKCHIDLIFSDNSLPNNKEGIDFLTEYRLKGNFKYYILYSNLKENDIIKKIADKLDKNKKVHLFSNFDFISLKNWEDRVDDAIGAFLNNRNKLEELRNMYIVENALIEDRLKDLLSTTDTYYNMINKYLKKNNINKKYNLAKVWSEVRKDRNVLAHGEVTFENGFNKVSLKDKNKKLIVVSEKEFYKKIEKLKELDEELENLNFF